MTTNQGASPESSELAELIEELLAQGVAELESGQAGKLNKVFIKLTAELVAIEAQAWYEKQEKMIGYWSEAEPSDLWPPDIGFKPTGAVPVFIKREGKS